MDQGLISQLSLPDEHTGPAAHRSSAWRGWTEKQVETLIQIRVCSTDKFKYTPLNISQKCFYTFANKVYPI